MRCGLPPPGVSHVLKPQCWLSSFSTHRERYAVSLCSTSIRRTSPAGGEMKAVVMHRLSSTTGRIVKSSRSIHLCAASCGRQFAMPTCVPSDASPASRQSVAFVCLDRRSRSTTVVDDEAPVGREVFQYLLPPFHASWYARTAALNSGASFDDDHACTR